MKILFLVLSFLLFGYSSGYYVMPEEVYFVESPSDRVVCEGCRVELTCTILRQMTAANLPQPEIKWMMTNGSDVSLEVAPSAQVATGNFLNSTLSIPAFQPEHQGSYRCVAIDGNNTANCSSPRFPCVPLVTISREARIEIQDNNTSISDPPDAHVSNSPWNETTIKETRFIDPETTNGSIKISCPIDESAGAMNVSIDWYRNGEKISTSERRSLTVSGNATQLYGVYQCFASIDGRGEVELSITRVLPHGLTNPPSVVHNILEIPKPTRIINSQGLYIEWAPPFFTGNLSLDSLQYEVTLDYERVTSAPNTPWVETFYPRASSIYIIDVAVINSGRNISESSPSIMYDVRGDCFRKVRFPPNMTLSCDNGAVNLSWIDHMYNTVYLIDHSVQVIYHLYGVCEDNAGNITEPVNTEPYVSPLILANRFETGTRCWFRGATTVNNNECRNSGYPCCNCICYDPRQIEYGAVEFCVIRASVGIENVIYVVHEIESSVEVCVVAEGYGFTVDITTVGVTARGGEDFSPVNQTITFDRNSRRQCININISDDLILENNEMFKVVLSVVSASLVDIITESALIEIEDNDYVTATFNVSSDVVSEDVLSLEVCVQLPVIEKNATLYMTTFNNTAKSGEDFVFDQDSVTFSPTSSGPECVTITIIDDEVLEYRESFSITLDVAPGTSGVLTSEESLDIYIEDNDVVNITLSKTSYTVSEEQGSLPVCADITSGSLGRNVTLSVGIIAINNTANGEDFSLTELQLQFNSSHIADCINISIIDDDIMEDSERFTVMMDHTRLASNQTAAIEIEDNDYVTISFAPDLESTVSEPTEGDVPVNICVEVKGRFETANPIEVYVEATNDSALSGRDYNALTGVNSRFQFHPDGPPKICRDNIVSVMGDRAIEYEERFNISLRLHSTETQDSVQLGNTAHAIVNIQDNRPNCPTSVRHHNETFHVTEPNSSVSITLILETECWLERDINVTVIALGSENGHYKTTEVNLTFNNNTRRDTFDVLILNLPENEHLLHINLYIPEPEYIEDFPREVTVNTHQPQSNNNELAGGLTGVFLAVGVVVVTGLIIAIITITVKRYKAKRDDGYRIGNFPNIMDFSDDYPDPPIDIDTPYKVIEPDTETLLLELVRTENTKDQTELDIPDATLAVEKLPENKVDVESSNQDSQDPTPRKDFDSGLIESDDTDAAKRKISGSSTSRTEDTCSSSSHPYIQCTLDNSGNTVCMCSPCVSQRYYNQNSKQQADNSLPAASQTAAVDHDGLPSNDGDAQTGTVDQSQINAPDAEIKYMNTTVSLELVQEPPHIEHEPSNATSPSERSVLLGQDSATQRDTQRETTDPGLTCHEQQRKVDLAQESCEVESALADFVDTSAGCGGALNDNQS